MIVRAWIADHRQLCATGWVLLSILVLVVLL